MKLSTLNALLSLTLLTSATKPIPPPGPDGKYTLTAPGITAKFIPYAASITNLLVPDRNGTLRDIVLGYDNASFYPVDPNHSDYGAVPGRYANRIANHTYVLNGTRYFTEANDGNGTLHSGLNGWSRRTWNVSAVSDTSITFTILDTADSSMGMPGTVMGSVTHSVANSSWSTIISARAVDHATPLMLTTHPYWNLDAFANPDTDLIFNHTLSLPFGRRIVGIDENTQSTGLLPDVPRGDINDFWSRPKLLGEARNNKKWVGNCGTAGKCAGYNNQWVVERGEMMKGRGKGMGIGIGEREEDCDREGEEEKPVASLWSGWSGIKWDLYSDQVGVVVYSCHWMGGGNQLKASQGGKASNGFVRSNGCVAVEPQDLIDGINHPEWNRTAYQISAPGMAPFTSRIQYKFSTIP